MLCWDLRKGELLSRWRDSSNSAQVTVVAQSNADPNVYAVGYSDGTIRIWDATIGQVLNSFDGHKSGITVLAFDEAGARLASGAQDTDIIVWDLLQEQGLFKLRGHKNQVTGLAFLEPSRTVADDEEVDGNLGAQKGDYLISAGKDALLKLWDLSSQHCVETHISQSNGECSSLGVSANGEMCITGGNEGELRIWQIDSQALLGDSSATRKVLVEKGAIFRHIKTRTVGITFDRTGKYIATHGTQRAVEIFRLRSPKEVQKSLARKQKRRKEKAKEKDEQTDGIEVEDEPVDLSHADISEFIVPHTIVRPSGSVKSVDWSGASKRALQLLISTRDNQVEVYDVQADVKERKSKTEQVEEYSRAYGVDVPGHRTNISSLALSSDDRMLASSSNGSLKVWNVRTQTCIRSLACGHATCAAFLPGDKIVVVGTKTGELEMFDIASSTLLETVKAHDEELTSLHVHPDGKSVVTGSKDKTAKFWEFKIVQEDIPGTRRTYARLKLVHSRTLKTADSILSVRYSPDGRLLAAALGDNTVKVFFTDSLKLFLNLYGHHLPVLSLDISYDSKLIVTCAADRNVRVWGLDFGDCHKAFFAHKEPIMQVAFVPHNQEGNGHHFFSVSKDRTIKYWDGDKFEQIQRLDGHHDEINAVAVSKTGDFVVSGGNDKGIRVWEQTDEQVFLEEEREKELEEMYEKTLTTSLEGEEDPNGENAEAVAAGKQTTETLMAGERVMEALDVGLEDLEVVRQWEAEKRLNPKLAPPQRNLIFMALGNISAEEHVLGVIQKIKAAALQDALLVLPFERVKALFTFIRIWAQQKMDMPLTCRVLFFMLKTHHRQIVASRTMRPMLDDIRQDLRGALQQQKDQMGFNLAALRHMGAQVREQKASNYVDEDTWQDEEVNKGRKKRSFLDVA